MTTKYKDTFNKVIPGQPISSEFLNKITASIITNIKGGRGIQVINRNNQVIINNTIGNFSGGGGSGGVSGLTWMVLNTLDKDKLYGYFEGSEYPVEAYKPPHLRPYIGTVTDFMGNVWTVTEHPTSSDPNDNKYLHVKIVLDLNDIDPAPDQIIMYKRVEPCWYEGEKVLISKFKDPFTGETYWQDVNVQGRKFEYGPLPYYVDL